MNITTKDQETRKPYHKPEISQVKLVLEEAVLGDACKTAATAAGMGSICSSCSATYGS